MHPIAQALYHRRIQKGLTQRELAVRAGLPQPNLSQIEKGRDFKVSTLLQLAAALDTPVTELLRVEPPFKIEKKKFFERETLEKVAAYLAGQAVRLPASLKPAAELLKDNLGVLQTGRIGKKQMHLNWVKLRALFSTQEINAILSRVEKAKGRAHGSR